MLNEDVTIQKQKLAIELGQTIYNNTIEHQQKKILELETLLKRIQPYLDKLICYASTTEEYEPNLIIKDINDYLNNVWRG